MIANLCRLRPGGVNARLGGLAKHGLVSKEHHTTYNGFRLCYGGYDYLALHVFSLRGTVQGIGRQIGVGKESDVYIVEGQHPSLPQEGFTAENEVPMQSFALKVERLGRMSFRTVKSNRDYLGNRKHASWMYMSRLAAEKEWAFLNALYKHGFPTPKPIDWNRHCIVMEHIDGQILEQVHKEDWPSHVDPVQIAQYLYPLLINWLIRLADHGLIHGDFNEFNIMLRRSFIMDPHRYMSNNNGPDDGPIAIIDFPQMVSTSHANAQELFDRDVNCLRRFFSKRYEFDPIEWPNFFRDVKPICSLDRELKASGHQKAADKDLGQGEDDETQRSDPNKWE